MKKYIGVKMVMATPMNAWDAHEKGYNTSGPIDSDVDGYEVEYEDGYKSWSPKKVFEKAYRQTNNLTFGLAIEALKKGHAVAREGWNGKRMWLKLIDGDNYHINMFPQIEGQAPGVESLLPWIGMKTADNKFVPWLASQTDMLSEDWCIVE